STFFAHVNTDNTVLVWDLARQGLKQPPARQGITGAGLEALWADLSGEDARQAFRAAGYLASVSAQSVPFLRERLRPVVAPPPQSIAGHIKDLDSKQFEAREKARVALERMEELPEPALRQALKGDPSLEMRRRLEQLLDRLDEAWRSPERVRTARA